MGVLPIVENEAFRLSDGREAVLYADTTTGDLGCDDGEMTILVTVPGPPECRYRLDVPLRDTGERWIRRFRDAFAHDGAFRERWRTDADGTAATMQGLPNLPAAPNTEVSEDVRRLNNLAGNARFRDFAGLRSGRDQFSRLRGEALAAMVHEASRVEVGDLLRAAGAVGDDEATDKALRWALRGLRPHLAVRKVMVDRGIAGNASGRRTSG